MKITKLIETETGHRLTNYSGKCACFHGHRYRWEVTVESDQLTETGFVMDFSDLKDILKDTVNQIDHAFLFHELDPLILELGPERAPIVLRATHGGTSRIFILPFNPTSENLVEWMSVLIDARLPYHIKLRRIKLWETSTSYTIWNPEK